jgi:hypothetical protein
LKYESYHRIINECDILFDEFTTTINNTILNINNIPSNNNNNSNAHNSYINEKLKILMDDYIVINKLNKKLQHDYNNILIIKNNLKDVINENRNLLLLEKNKNEQNINKILLNEQEYHIKNNDLMNKYNGRYIYI